MKPKARFIASVIKTSKEDMPAPAFQRGARRTAFIVKRNTATQQAKSA